MEGWIKSSIRTNNEVVSQPYHINLRMLGGGQMAAFGFGFISRLIMIFYESELISYNSKKNYKFIKYLIFEHSLIFHYQF